jgi:hypothetical protein
LSSLLPRKNLVLVVDEARCDPADFMDIANRIRAQAADVHIQVLQPKTIHAIARDTWHYPTLFVCLVHIRNLQIKRGKLMVTLPIPKLQQAEMMRLANVSTPHMEPYHFGMRLEESLWGSHVVLKPDDLGFTSHGTGLEIIPAKELSGKLEQEFAPDHFVRAHKMLVQRFIDTGPQPSCYRACLFMGEVLYISKVTADVAKQGADIPPNFHSKDARLSNEFGQYPHIHAFGRKMATAFPLMPLLGCDILEEPETGNLYGIEVNAGGNVWHFSSPYLAKSRQRDPQFNAPRLNQYGAFDVAARALINATRRLAI